MEYQICGNICVPLNAIWSRRVWSIQPILVQHRANTCPIKHSMRWLAQRIPNNHAASVFSTIFSHLGTKSSATHSLIWTNPIPFGQRGRIIASRHVTYSTPEKSLVSGFVRPRGIKTIVMDRRGEERRIRRDGVLGLSPFANRDSWRKRWIFDGPCSEPLKTMEFHRHVRTIQRKHVFL